jgi:nucleotide-binding universal stress UspA family protein
MAKITKGSAAAQRSKRRSGTQGMKILLAVDGSPYSAAAVEAVKRRPWPPGTLVRVLSAVPDAVPTAADLYAAPTLDESRRLMESAAEQLTDEVANTVRASELTVETAVRHGDPRSVIIDEATQWQADLIVVGSHGYTGIKRWLLGSVAQSVVAHAPCSVEVVRQKEKKEA